MTESVIRIDGKVVPLLNSEANGPKSHPPPEPTLFKRGTDLDTSPPAPLLAGRLDHEHTVLYGPGGVGKGALACEWVRRLVNDGEVVLILDYEDHEGEWGRRLDGLGVDLTKVYWLAPLKSRLRGVTDEQTVETIATEAARLGVTFVVVDSIAMACFGADLMDPTTAVAYFAALQYLGVPSLSLAHVNRQSDLRYPFGSVYWHNIPRLTWSLSPRGGDVLLQNRKASNYRPQPSYTVECDWWNDRLAEVREVKAEVSLLERVTEILALAGTPMSANDIVGELNNGLPGDEQTDVRTVRRTLSRDLSKPLGSGLKVVPSKNGDLWTLKGDND